MGEGEGEGEGEGKEMGVSGQDSAVRVAVAVLRP